MPTWVIIRSLWVCNSTLCSFHTPTGAELSGRVRVRNTANRPKPSLPCGLICISEDAYIGSESLQILPTLGYLEPLA